MKIVLASIIEETIIRIAAKIGIGVLIVWDWLINRKQRTRIANRRNEVNKN